MNIEHPTISRRNFLKHALFSWLIMLCLPVCYAIIKYIVPPTLKERIIELLNIGKVSDVPINSVKIVKFNKSPIVLVHTSDDQFKAFSAVCTHLGCIIEYRDNERDFHCNCHGSVFDLNGKNIAGPAPKPLIPYKVELKEDSIYVSKS